MRAQISVETLLVFLLFLILLGIAYTASTRLGAASQQQINKALSRESLSELSSKMEQACLLGDGNVRAVSIKGPEATLAVSGRDLSFEAGGFTGAYKSPCDVDLQNSKSSEFKITNEGGTLKIS